ncbi:MAG: YHS domain-containing protein, partial [Betaproteobacteria bacterium]|nr:YHS domain-containing protein [Betaproteobacteria bacterium]
MAMMRVAGATKMANEATQDMSSKDPVCGMRVQPGKEAGTLTHGGKTYSFCSTHCLNTFKADPGRYLQETALAHGDHTHHAQPAPTRAAAPAPAGAQYTCPMHPEVLKDGPGDCPICGMALVPVGAAAADG